MEGTAEEYAAEKALLARHLDGASSLGLVGVGRLGSAFRRLAVSRGVKVLLCDPPRSLAEAEELGERFFGLWGNGMGGCELTGEGLETFLPLHSLARADVIAVQVPLTDGGRFPTRGMLGMVFLRECSAGCRILNFSSPDVLTADAQNDPRVVLMLH